MPTTTGEEEAAAMATGETRKNKTTDKASSSSSVTVDVGRKLQSSPAKKIMQTTMNPGIVRVSASLA